ncbi:MAG: hypothetical protein HYT87_03495 [Nitrospirae bacterium]|nr:hypothetical protein [Nitrospirota bacterium]
MARSSKGKCMVPVTWVLGAASLVAGCGEGRQSTSTPSQAGPESAENVAGMTAPVITFIELRARGDRAILVGGTETFIAYPKDASGTGVGPVNLKWNVSDPGIAEVTKAPEGGPAAGVTARSPGQATLQACCVPGPGPEDDPQAPRCVLEVCGVTTVLSVARDAVTALSSGVPGALASVSFPSDDRTGFAGGDGSTLLKTSDGGSSWTRVGPSAGAGFVSIAFPSGTSLGFALAGSAVWKTPDGGSSWSKQEHGSKSVMTALHFPSESVGYAVGGSGMVAKTTDGGATWKLVPTGASVSLRGLYFINAETGYAVGDSGMILKTTDGGGAWTTQAPGVPGYLSDIVCADAALSIAVGNLTILRTTDGGSNWSPHLAYPELTAVHLLSDGRTGYAVGGNGRILKTVDGGETWVLEPSGTTAKLWDVHFPPNGRTGFIVGDNGTILKIESPAL